MKKRSLLCILLSFFTLTVCTSCVMSDQAKSSSNNNLEDDPNAYDSSPDTTSEHSKDENFSHKFIHVAYRDTLSDIVSSDEGLYSIRCLDGLSANIFYTDIETGQEVFLCNQPNCTHDISSCTSYVSVPDGLSVPTLAYFHNTLFLIKTSTNEYGNACITRMDLNGSNQKILCEFKSNQTVGMYAFGYDEFLVLDVTETTEDGSSSEFLCQVDVNSGDISKLIDIPRAIDNMVIRPMTCYEENLIFTAINPNRSITLFYFNPFKNNFESIESLLDENTLTQFSQESGNAYVRDGYLCEIDRNSSTISKTNLETGKKDSFQYEDVPGATAGIEYLFDGVITLTFLDTNSQQQYYVDFDNQTLTKLNFTNTYNHNSYTLLGEYGEDALFRTGYKEIALRQGHDEGAVAYIAEMHLIKKADYIQDIHEEKVIENAI